MGAYIQKDDAFFRDGKGQQDAIVRRDGYRIFPAESAFQLMKSQGGMMGIDFQKS